MIVNGWRLHLYPLFDRKLQRLEEQVEALAFKDPLHDTEHALTKLLAAIRRLMLEIIPRDPNAAEFRQGNTLGPANRHWFRAKFHQRYRLFYRFSSQLRVIVFVWVNDERTLRKAGSKTDPYAVFRAMIEAGNPPNSMEELVKRSREM